jgi:AcrR family transcriptional regulator
LRERRRLGDTVFERSFERCRQGGAVSGYDDRRDQLLQAAARVFAQGGYDRTSMRDLARAARMSLAGMYYYVRGKEDLLFQIQRSCFERVHAGALAAIERESAPEARLAAFITHHVTYFVGHMNEMKVLAHEAESLTGEPLDEIQRLKRRYVDQLLELLAALDGQAGDPVSRHVAAYTLFGMMNWLYTWYRPGGAVGPDELAHHITRLFLNGYQVEVAAR